MKILAKLEPNDVILLSGWEDVRKFLAKSITNNALVNFAWNVRNNIEIETIT